MPVTVAAPYRTYDAKRSNGTLDLSGTCCPDAFCRESTGGAALILTGSVVGRWLILLERDAHGEWEAVRVRVLICLARCPGCGRRFRVLPCDVLPWKQYTVPVIEVALDLYRGGDWSLRGAVAQILGERTPVHAALHGWTDGLGAFALGRTAGELPGCMPASRLLVETEARVPAVASVRLEEPEIPPVRYRSEPRRERLAASFILVACAVVIAAAHQPPGALSEWSRLLLRSVQGASCWFAFRSSLRCTRFEHPDRASQPSSPSHDRGERKRWLDRTRSPPGASNR